MIDLFGFHFFYIYIILIHFYPLAVMHNALIPSLKVMLFVNYMVTKVKVYVLDLYALYFCTYVFFFLLLS
jgi:hypothetical protein